MKNQWQPMETAPKDGSKFLMFMTSMTIDNIVKQTLIAHYSSEFDCFIAHNSNRFFYLDSKTFNAIKKFDIYVEVSQANNWMPLPKPPVIKT